MIEVLTQRKMMMAHKERSVNDQTGAGIGSRIYTLYTHG